MEIPVAATDRGVSALSLPLTYSTAKSRGSTVNGIGSVTGRVILSVGEFALKGIEVINIQRSISTIYTMVVSSEGKAPLDDRMCRELLELSRRGMYTARIKKKAWASILILIATGNSSKLVEHVLKWRDADIKLFLVDLLRAIPRGWLFTALGDPLPVSKGARYLQESGSCLPMQLLYFLNSLLDASARKAGVDSMLENSHVSVTSLASFVNETGKMALGPGVFLRDLDIYVGHAAVSNVIKFYITARLNRISTLLRIFIGESSPAQDGVDLHSEILEVYRLFAHDQSIQRQTKELLFISISRFHAVSLVWTIGRWSPMYQRLFIILVMRWTLAFVKPSLSLDDNTLPKAYRVHLVLHTKTQHPVLPFLYFFTQLALVNSFAAEVLLELNIVPALKMMCINNYPNPAAFITSPRNSKDGIAISDVCAMSIMLIGALSVHSTTCRRLLRLRDFPRWFLSFYYHSEFLGIPSAPVLQNVWMDLEKPLLKFVLACVEHVLKDETLTMTPQEADYLPLERIYREIIDVLRDPASEPEMLQSAADSLFRCIVLKGEFVNVMDVTFANGRAEETIAVLHIAVQSLGLCSSQSALMSAAEENHPRRPSSGDIPPFPPADTPLLVVKRYVRQLARLYTDDLKIYTALVADLIGSQACNAQFTLLEPWSQPIQPLPDHATAGPSDRLSETSESSCSFRTVTSHFS